MKLRIVLPVVYLVAAAFCLFGPPGGGGHGSGPALLYYLSMPVVLIFAYVLKGDEYTLLFPIAAIAQYFLLGYLLDRLIGTKSVTRT